MRVAIVHDWLTGVGGAENVLFDIHTIFPDAPIYTLVYDKQKAPEWTRACDIRTTYLQKIPKATSLYKYMLTLMPKAWEALDLTEFDLVISSCSSCAKGVVTRPDAVHICYCHSPIRYVWDLYYDYMASSSFIKKLAMKKMIHKMKIWDSVASERVDYFVANSYNIANRIRKFYRRDSNVIYPGCHINDYQISDDIGDYYLVVSRLVPYKKIDLAIKACNELRKHLIIVGTGEQDSYLRKIAGPTVEIRGFLASDELQKLYLHAKAFLFPGDEDFGITPVEAQSAGTPVLAYGHGGALETVLDGKTGLFFCEQTAESLAECITRFENCGVAFSRKEIRESCLRFSNERFIHEFKTFCDEKICEYRKKLVYYKSFD